MFVTTLTSKEKIIAYDKDFTKQGVKLLLGLGLLGSGIMVGWSDSFNRKLVSGSVIGALGVDLIVCAIYDMCVRQNN